MITYTIESVGAEVLSRLSQAKDMRLSRKKLVEYTWQQFDLGLLERTLAALEKAGFIDVLDMKDGIGYRLTKQTLEKLQG